MGIYRLEDHAYNDDDDDVYPPQYGRRGGRRYYQQQAYYNDDHGTMYGWEMVNSVLNFFTGSRVGVFVAMLAVLLVQYRQTAMLWYQCYRTEGLVSTLSSIFVETVDCLRAYCQLAQEYIRGFRAMLGLTTDDAAERDSRVQRDYPHPCNGSANGLPPLVGNSDGNRHSVRPGRSRNARKRKGRRNQQPVRNSSMPGLQTSPEDSSDVASIDPHTLSDDDEYAIGTSGDLERILDPSRELEPAFLQDEDYPPGWLVFHPRLGVVPKEDADAYDKQQRHCNKENEVLSNHEDGHDKLCCR